LDLAGASAGSIKKRELQADLLIKQATEVALLKIPTQNYPREQSTI
jgi:hypothetical protein